MFATRECRFAFIAVLVAMLLPACTSSPSSSASKSKPASKPKSSSSSRSTSAKSAHDKTKTPPRPSESELKAAEERRAEAFARFATGYLHDLRDEDAQALENFEKAIKSDPSQDGLALDVARRHLLLKENDKAIAVLQDAISAGGSGVLSAFLASIYGSLGRTQDAIAANQVAIKKTPTLLLGYQNLAALYVKENQLEEAIKVLEQANQVEKPSAQFQIELAELWLSLPKTKPETTELGKRRAAELLDRAVKAADLPSTSLQRAADAYMAVGQSSKAIDLYLKLVEKYPQATPIRERLADLFLQSRDSKRAIEQMQALIREEPSKYPQAYLILGSLSLQEGKFQEAEDYLRKALVLSPQMEAAYYDLAIAQVNGGKVSDGLETLDDARRRFSETFQTEFFSGVAYARLKDYPKAVARFTSAEIIAGSRETNRLTHLFYFQLGSAHERNQNLEEAERYFRKSLALMPEFSEALNYLGYMWVEHGLKLQEAREMIEKAVKLEPKNSAFQDSLAWAFFKLGKPKEALPWILKAIENVTEHDATLFDHLGDIQQALGESAKAAEAWKKSLSVEANPAIQKKLDDLSRTTPAAK